MSCQKRRQRSYKQPEKQPENRRGAVTFARWKGERWYEREFVAFCKYLEDRTKEACRKEGVSLKSSVETFLRGCQVDRDARGIDGECMG